jgi:hypothetical protein
LDRLEEERKGRGFADECLERRLGFDEGKRSVGNSAGGEDVLRPSLVEAQRERERVAAGVRDVEEFADRGNVGLAIRSVETFGDVEDDVGASGAESFGEFFGRLEGDDVAERGERRRDGSDGLCGVPFRATYRAPKWDWEVVTERDSWRAAAISLRLCSGF